MQKTIGLIGGLTWLSTLDYYRLINQLTNQQLGRSSSAKILLYSVNFEEVKTLTIAGNWDGIAKLMTSVAQNLENAGADCILLGANTMHHVADKVRAAINIPLIHIAEVTATAIKLKGLQTVALLGTKYTMQLPFYSNKLAEQGIKTIIPNQADIDFVNESIYTELGNNIFLPATKEKYLNIIASLVAQGAEGVILGCTEIPIFIKQTDCTVPVFDTALIHATAAVHFALGS